MVSAMKDTTKTEILTNRWTGAAPLLLLPVWVGAMACFFYFLVRTGFAGQ